jgi:hypothetical protein
MFSESPSNYKLMAKLLISAQVSISFGALVLYNYYIQQSMFITVSAILAFVIAFMGMSNATKNRTDAFSRFMQSYSTKTHSAIFYCSIALFYEME